MTLALAVSGVGALAKVGPGGVGLGRAKWEDLGIRVWERVPPLPASVRRHQQPESRSLHGDPWPVLSLLRLQFNGESGTRRLMRPICPLSGSYS